MFFLCIVIILTLKVTSYVFDDYFCNRDSESADQMSTVFSLSCRITLGGPKYQIAMTSLKSEAVSG